MMTQLDILAKHVMGGGQKTTSVVGSANDMPLDGVPYDGGYSEKVHYVGN